MLFAFDKARVDKTYEFDIDDYDQNLPMNGGAMSYGTSFTGNTIVKGKKIEVTVSIGGFPNKLISTEVHHPVPNIHSGYNSKGEKTSVAQFRFINPNTVGNRGAQTMDIFVPTGKNREESLFYYRYIRND